jgi:hypothetical protein
MTRSLAVVKRETDPLDVGQRVTRLSGRHRSLADQVKALGEGPCGSRCSTRTATPAASQNHGAWL